MGPLLVRGSAVSVPSYTIRTAVAMAVCDAGAIPARGKCASHATLRSALPATLLVPLLVQYFFASQKMCLCPCFHVNGNCILLLIIFVAVVTCSLGFWEARFVSIP